MSCDLNIGFIGFGEAGSSIARGLRGAGVNQLFAYDINTHTPRLGEKIHERAQMTRTALVDSSEELALASNLLLSTVTASVAIDAADQTAPFLTSRHFYLDLNSVSPAAKQSVELITRRSGARFVEGAIMAAVKPHCHRVPILLGGANAQALVELLTPLGMRLEVVSEKVGTASAIKMCRSIVVKGLEALLFECVLASSRYDADEAVFASLNESLPGIDWPKLASYTMARVIEHGERRAREMDEVAETLRAVGIEPIMAEATALRQELGARLDLLTHFGGKPPENYRAVLQAIAGVTGNNRRQTPVHRNSH
jgi:3-hydroxyisobutyrate dehydrogenase-like beta-hydroxyacid dehydrogenase